MLCFVHVSKAQQTAFLPMGNDNMYPDKGLTAYNLPELFKNPEEYTSLSIRPEDLDSISGYDFSKLVNLELIHFEYSFDPESSDSEKKEFRKKTRERFEKLKAFSVCPKLRTITFLIGEEIYVDKNEMKPKSKLEARDYDSQYRRLTKANLRNAWIDFGKDLNQSLPGAKLYAENWGW
jgi:hypothetical protein